MSNREFAKADGLFNSACKLAETEATKRQASKWANKRGIAYKFRRQAANAIMELQRVVQGEQGGPVKEEEKEVQKVPRI